MLPGLYVRILPVVSMGKRWRLDKEVLFRLLKRSLYMSASRWTAVMDFSLNCFHTLGLCGFGVAGRVWHCRLIFFCGFY